MKPIKWNDKLSVDHGLIDKDHHFLIKIINNFREQVGHFNSSDEAMEILKALKFYSKKHFGREEELQRVAKFPYREAHHNEHMHLIMKLEKLMEETQDASGDYLNTVMGEKIGEFLHDWLIDHVLYSDLRMKPHVEHMKELSKKLGELE